MKLFTYRETANVLQLIAAKIKRLSFLSGLHHRKNGTKDNYEVWVEL